MEYPTAHVTPHSVVVDGVELPGLIEEDSVHVAPGPRGRHLRLTVTFAVKNVDFVRGRTEDQR